LFDLDNESYDLFVITAKETEVIKDMLLERNIKNEKILEFWKMYNAGIPSRVCDRAILNPKVESFEGVILGTGHAANGILTSQLNKSFCNLAVSSQDIYYNYVTLKYCLENYPEKLQDLKYAIIDMYDYNYFNYDASQSNAIVDYVLSGGITTDEHNFSKNKRYNKLTFQQFVETIESEKFAGITDVDFANWSVNFPEIYTLSDFEGFGFNDETLKNRTSVVTDEEIDAYNFRRAVANDVYDKTIDENMKWFEKTLDLLLKVNPEINIYLILIPKFVENETKDAFRMYKHKIIFNEKINTLKKVYNFEYVDFKDISDFMIYRKNFIDPRKFNWYGATKFTNEFNKIILK
jgi:hypothetical protein